MTNLPNGEVPIYTPLSIKALLARHSMALQELEKVAKELPESAPLSSVHSKLNNVRMAYMEFALSEGWPARDIEADMGCLNSMAQVFISVFEIGDRLKALERAISFDNEIQKLRADYEK